MKILPLASILLFSSITNHTLAAEKTVAEPITLSNAELQDLLGVKAWKISVPEGYSHIALRYVIEGEIQDRGIRAGSIPISSTDRTAIITLTKNPTSYTARTQCGGYSFGEIPIPQFTEEYKKSFHRGANVSNNKNPILVDNEIELLTHEIVATDKDQRDLSKVKTSTFATLKVFVRLFSYKH